MSASDSSFYIGQLADFSCISSMCRKKAYEKKRRETELALLDKARGEDTVGESSVQLGLLSLSDETNQPAVTEA